MHAIRFMAVFALAFLLGLAPSTTHAADVRSDGAVTVGAAETVNDDLYVFGGTTTVEGTVTGDVVASGGTITIDGNVQGDVLAAGGTVTIAGEVGESVRVAGGTVNVNGAVAEDLVVGGGTTNVGSRARIGRDLLAAGGTTTIDGEVVRNVRVGGDDVTLSGPIGGNVNAHVDALRLTSDASIGGDLRYTSEREAVVEPGAAVRGTTERHIPQAGRDDRGFVGPFGEVIGWLRTLVGLLLLGGLFVLLFPGFSRRTAGTIGSSPWASLGVGFAMLFVVPILALILFIVGLFIGGWWLALILLGLYATVLLLGIVVAGLFLGGWVLRRAGWRRGNIVWALLLGVALLMLVGLVPWVGGLLVLVAMLFGVGGLALAFVRARREPTAPAAA